MVRSVIRIDINHYYRITFEVIKERGVVYLFEYMLIADADMVMRNLNQFYSYVYSRLFKAPLVHVVGDSHSWAFKRHRSFIIHNIGPATAYNLINQNSTIQSNKKLFEVIDRIDVKKDLVVLVFGEIDCRVHFYNQYMKHNGKISLDKLMDMTIANYGTVLCQLKERGINFLVYGVLPASKCIIRFPPYATKKIREDLLNSFKNNYPYQASPELRSTINYQFNEKLKAYCEERGFKYLNIYSVVADENGFIKDEFAADEIHVNGKIMPYVKDMLEKECDIKT